MSLVKLYKPNGKEVEVSEKSVKYAIEVLEWSTKKPSKSKASVKNDSKPTD